MTERKPDRQSWDSFREEQLKKALDTGAFEKIEGLGEPLDFANPFDDDWWVKDKLRREQLNMLPPALAIRLDVQKTLGTIANLNSESEVRTVVADLNDRIKQAHFSVATGPPCTTMPLEIEKVVRQWRDSQAN